jgi:hypothetical protein
MVCLSRWRDRALRHLLATMDKSLHQPSELAII